MASCYRANSYRLQMVPGALIRIVGPCWEGSGKNSVADYCDLPCLERASGHVSEAHCASGRTGREWGSSGRVIFACLMLKDSKVFSDISGTLTLISY